MSPIFEVVSGQVLLSRRQDFFDLHSGILVPMMEKIGIQPVIFLFTELGRYGRFLDIYRYENLSEYDRLTSQLLAVPEIEDYYRRVGDTIDGSIQVEIMRELPYSPGKL